MILVTLGTQDKKFYRVLEELDNLIKKKKINDEVIVQAGCSDDYQTDNMKIFDLIPMEELDKMIKECKLLITHGGVGSILNGLKYHKKIIAIPRLMCFGEHVNDHQKQIVNIFSEEGYILKVDDIHNLYNTIKQLDNFKPKRYISNNNNFVKLLEGEINKLIGVDNDNNI